MWYGSVVRRHGRSRPFLRYQPSRRRRNSRRAAGAGILGEPVDPLEPFIIANAVKIYTKTGDSGETALFDGTGVSKWDARVAAYGDVDELNAWVGFARARVADEPEIGDMLVQVQRDLLALGARLADPRKKIA